MKRAYQIIWKDHEPSPALETAERAVRVASAVVRIQWQDGVRMIQNLESRKVGTDVHIRQWDDPPAGIIRVVDIDDCWVIACGGTEEPFLMNGKSYTYYWNCATHRHAYYCHGEDVFLTPDEFEARRVLRKVL
jgi:hypothetical protein